MESKSLDIRYACIHGFYWMICCAMIGYASVFLLDKGFDNTTIGIVLSISNILAVFGQPAVASYMDKTSRLSLRMLISCILVPGVCRHRYPQRHIIYFHIEDVFLRIIVPDRV